MSETIKALEEQLVLHSGTALGKVIGSAIVLIEQQNEALATFREVEELWINEYANCKSTIELIKGGLELALKDCVLPVNPYETIARDMSSHINCMAAHGVEPYSKRVKGWRSDKKKTKSIPPMEFALGCNL
jgi:hypothetical protein